MSRTSVYLDRKYIQMQERIMMLFIFLLIIAYLLGSISSAILVCQLANLPDPRTAGSGNPGASNVLRLSTKKHAVLVLLGDMLKGMIILAVGRLFDLHGNSLAWLAVAVVLGHLYPLFFQFKGGKGVATAFGSLIILTPGLALVAMLVWGSLVKLTHYASVASLTAAITVVLLNPFMGDLRYETPIIVLAILLFWRHRANIQRLFAGTENKML